jgi:hypothetical protein
MALTMEKLHKLTKAIGFKVFQDPDQDAFLARARGLHGVFEVLILLEVEGQFLQFRTLGYHSCPWGSPNVDPTLRLLAELNYRLRFLKFGWNENDGEIAVYGDMWIADGDVTEQQLDRMLNAYLSALDLNYQRIDQTIKTGRDPGEVDPLEVAREASGADLPPELKELVDGLLSGSKDGNEDEEEGDTMDSI